MGFYDLKKLFNREDQSKLKLYIVQKKRYYHALSSLSLRLSINRDDDAMVKINFFPKKGEIKVITLIY
jgi:hypothetical protein